MHESNLDVDISAEEFDTLILHLQNHVDEKLVGDSENDISPIVFRMKYSVGKARKFVQKYNLDTPE